MRLLCAGALIRLRRRNLSVAVVFTFQQRQKQCPPDICFYGQGTGGHGEARASEGSAPLIRLLTPTVANHHWPCEVRAEGMNGAGNRGVVEETAAYATQQFCYSWDCLRERSVTYVTKRRHMQPKPSSGRHCLSARCFVIRSNGRPFLKR